MHIAEGGQRGFRDKQLLLSCVHIVENRHHDYEGSLTSSAKSKWWVFRIILFKLCHSSIFKVALSQEGKVVLGASGEQQ